MKKGLPFLSLIILLAACSEPKMKLRAPEQKNDKKEVAAEKKDTLKTPAP